MKLLMHICCSNCSIYPLEVLLMKGVDIKGLWFNPNIHPYTEYAQRRDSLRKLEAIWGLDIEYLDEYPLDSFLSAITGKGTDRCSVCYATRLEKTAETAAKMRIAGFTTSLLASPYQKFDMIVELGKEAGRRHGVSFYYEDLRKGWNISRALASEFGLYRQKYCGCIYSEMERYMKKTGARK
ncbi:MAG: epoxyqueuosine reductase QueH [Nitrospiraceae bacterium]|nr:epoxyqueuosine reductase QueH [Nitrospiraceae bacterium]